LITNKIYIKLIM